MLFFFFNDTATTEIYTLSLHDALPISRGGHERLELRLGRIPVARRKEEHLPWIERRRPEVPDHAPEVIVSLVDRKSTRLNSSHANISYAVFCLKKKKNNSLSILLL